MWFLKKKLAFQEKEAKKRLSYWEKKSNLGAVRKGHLANI